MALLTKPNMQQVWASGGDIVEPSDLKKQQGWTVEVPPHQFENWLQNRQDQMLAHINQRGIPAWDGLTNYEAGGLSYVQGSDGKVYKSVAASGPSGVVSNPTTDVTDTYWTIAFADVGAFLTQTTGDARYTQRSNNLSDLTNVATARTNLGAAPLASPAFTGTPTAPTASAGTNTTQLATTAFVTTADNLKANINSPTFTGVPSAPTPASGTRSTAIATMQNFANEFGSSFAPSGWQRLPSGLIMQWGYHNGSLDDTSALINFPIAFPNSAFSITVTAESNLGTSGTSFITAHVEKVSLTQFRLHGSGTVTITTGYSWIAIGY